jgi:hypothetical protein
MGWEIGYVTNKVRLITSALFKEVDNYGAKTLRKMALSLITHSIKVIYIYNEDFIK